MSQVKHANRLRLKVCVPAGLLRWWRLFVQNHLPKRKRGERPVEDVAPPPSDCPLPPIATDAAEPRRRPPHAPNAFGGRFPGPSVPETRR
ncbi:MAG: hypothetical protein IJT88_09220 [Kiritimatiellae bacterium]|nr:hypothetical protein [Kiritimatiellia bacterium]